MHGDARLCVRRVPRRSSDHHNNFTAMMVDPHTQPSSQCARDSASRCVPAEGGERATCVAQGSGRVSTCVVRAITQKVVACVHFGGGNKRCQRHRYKVRNLLGGECVDHTARSTGERLCARMERIASSLHTPLVLECGSPPAVAVLSCAHVCVCATRA